MNGTQSTKIKIHAGRVLSTGEVEVSFVWPWFSPALIGGEYQISVEPLANLEAPGASAPGMQIEADDALITATVVVHRNGATACRLSFGRNVRFEDGRNAVRKAASALHSEIAESTACLAGQTQVRPMPGA